MKYQTLTDYFAKRAAPYLTVEPEVADESGLFSMFNSGGIECETGEFLYGLLRIMKPELVVETGTHKGISAAYMAQACHDNGRGVITTIEYESVHHNDAVELFQALGLTRYTNPLLVSSEDFEITEKHSVDMLFLDTEPQIRFAELVRHFDAVKPGGYILVHDLHRHLNQIENKEHGFAWPYGEIPPEMEDLFVTDQLRSVHFNTPRGLSMFYKPQEGTWRWN